MFGVVNDPVDEVIERLTFTFELQNLEGVVGGATGAHDACEAAGLLNFPMRAVVARLDRCIKKVVLARVGDGTDVVRAGAARSEAGFEAGFGASCSRMAPTVITAATRTATTPIPTQFHGIGYLGRRKFSDVRRVPDVWSTNSQPAFSILAITMLSVPRTAFTVLCSNLFLLAMRLDSQAALVTHCLAHHKRPLACEAAGRRFTIH